MIYATKEISNKIHFDSFPYNKALIAHDFPNKVNDDTPRLVTSSIGLYSHDDLPELQKTTFFSYLFGEKYTHCVILSQSSQKLHTSSLWVLCEANNEADVREGLAMIYRILVPLLQNGMVYLSQDLLDGVIVPSPVAPDNLGTIIVEMMEFNPRGHPDWTSVVEATLASPFSTKSCKRNMSILIERRGQIEDSVDLHTAARQNKSNSIRRMLIKKASVQAFNIPENVIDGEDPCSASDQQEIFDVIDPKSQDTPLYVSVEKGYVKSSMFFLLGGANANFVHPASGNTCLHLAAKQCSLQVIKLLLIFFADPTIENRNGETPLDMVSPECAEYDKILSLFQEIEYLKKQYELLPTDPVPISSEEGQYLLSLDGGGSRCVSEIQMLVAVEKRMEELNPNCKPFISHFDYVAGTSGGAFHALALVYNKVTLKNERALTANGSVYAEGSSPSVKTKGVETLLKNTLGDVRVMADVVSPRCIVTATLANTIPPKLHLITNYGESRDGQLGPKERKIWETARISSAAPTYFMSYDHFIDGGLMANNPTVDAIVEMNDQSMKLNGQPLKLSCVLSMGSGQDKPIDINNIDVSGQSSADPIRCIVEKVDGYKNLMTLIISQVTQAEGQDIARAKTLCDLSGGTYYRLVAPVYDKAIALDTSDPIDLIQPMFDSFLFTCRNFQLVDSIARKLLSNPRLYKETTCN